MQQVKLLSMYGIFYLNKNRVCILEMTFYIYFFFLHITWKSPLK